MKENKTYKIIIPYTESASPQKKFKVEYLVEAEDRFEAMKKAEKEFNSYSQNTSASWVRIADQSSIRLWRVFPNDSQNPQFIDDLINKLPCKKAEDTIILLERLGRLEDTTASSKIISLIKNDNPEIVAAAINTLGEIGDPSSFFAVENTYFQKDNPMIKLAVVNTLFKLALPDDNIIDFYRTAIHNPNTREAVFKIVYPSLIQLWLAEISNEKEFDMVKDNIIKLGEKALMILTTLNSKHPQVLSYAIKLVEALKPMAIKYQWEDWPMAIKKYKLQNSL